MSMLPFDRSGNRPPRPAPRTPVTLPPLSVSQAAELVKTVLATAVPTSIRVVGEVSNLSDRTHWFFSLKDEAATIRCVCFASSARRVGFPMRDGMEVVVTGRLDFYESQGHLQIYVDKIEPVGAGALELKYRALCEELRTLGYFAPERKKPLPTFARRIAIVTSRSAAALHDVLNTAHKRWPGIELLLFDVRVQGAAAAPEIAAAIDSLSRQGARLNIDAILLTRGGGSIEDLWAFNERLVADAIFRCKIPLVAAIGHETDTTIAELVADLRCATPTQAAMALIPERAALAHQLRATWQRLTLLTRLHVDRSAQHLQSLARHPALRRPQTMLEPWERRLTELLQRFRVQLPLRARQSELQLKQTNLRLQAALPTRLARAEERLTASARQLEAVSPLNVLQRGYSYTLDAAGHVLRRAADAHPGDQLTTVLSDGRVHSRVEDATASAPPLPTSRTSKRKKPTSDAPLFDSPASPDHQITKSPDHP